MFAIERKIGTIQSHKAKNQCIKSLDPVLFLNYENCMPDLVIWCLSYKQSAGAGMKLNGLYEVSWN